MVELASWMEKMANLPMFGLMCWLGVPVSSHKETADDCAIHHATGNLTLQESRRI